MKTTKLRKAIHLSYQYLIFNALVRLVFSNFILRNVNLSLPLLHDPFPPRPESRDAKRCRVGSWLTQPASRAVARLKTRYLFFSNVPADRLKNFTKFCLLKQRLAVEPIP